MRHRGDSVIPSYPSPKQLGERSVKNIFDGPVVVQEKLDGSQISFGVLGGELRVKSRSAPINVLAPDKMFSKAVEHLKTVQHLMPEGFVFRGEYLNRPKHNVLAYDRTPKGNIMLFDVQAVTNGNVEFLSVGEVYAWASKLGLEGCPLIHSGPLDGPEALRPMLDRVSVLGGAKIEGVVVKNYALAKTVEDTFAAKFVSEEFKEVHAGKAVGAERGPKEAEESVEDRIIRAHKTPARWQKAVQHLREQGVLTDSPKDIGLLVKEVQKDTLEECGDGIKNELFADFAPRLKVGIVDGLALWYKDFLHKKSFDG